MSELKASLHPNRKIFQEELQITDRILNYFKNPALDVRWKTALEEHFNILRKYHLDLLIAETRRDVELAHRARLALENPRTQDASRDVRDYIQTLQDYGYVSESKKFSKTWKNSKSKAVLNSIFNRKSELKEKPFGKPGFALMLSNLFKLI